MKQLLTMNKYLGTIDLIRGPYYRIPASRRAPCNFLLQTLEAITWKQSIKFRSGFGLQVISKYELRILGIHTHCYLYSFYLMTLMQLGHKLCLKNTCKYIVYVFRREIVCSVLLSLIYCYNIPVFLRSGVLFSTVIIL